MESTMPNKGGGDPAAGDAEGQPAEGEGHPGDDPAQGPAHEYPPGSAEAEAAEAEQRALEAEYADAYNLYHQKQQQAAREGHAGAEEDGEPSSRGRFHAPSPHPPPFSDEAVDGGYGFERGASSRREQQRAQDAFAYAEMDEDDQRDLFSPGEGALQSPEPVYGERVVLDEEGADAEAHRRASRDHLFAPPTPKSCPEGSGAASWAPGADSEGAGAGRSPRLADLGAPAVQPGFLTRSSSYESLHEID
jgi:hypothetical protein